MKPAWKGIYPALTTPFLPNETLDLPTLDLKVEVQIRSGCHGLILAGSLGEASTLSADEKIDLLTHVVGKVDGRVPVIMNVAESRLADALTFVRSAKLAGADGHNGILLLVCFVAFIFFRLKERQDTLLLIILQKFLIRLYHDT